MTDPIVTLGVASNVLQLGQIAVQLIKAAYRVHQNDGAFEGHTNIANATSRMMTLCDRIRMNAENSPNADMEDLYNTYNDVATELLDILEKLKVQGRSSVWKCLRKVLKSAWREEQVRHQGERLRAMEHEMSLQVMVDIRYTRHLLGSANRFTNSLFQRSSEPYRACTVKPIGGLT